MKTPFDPKNLTDSHMVLWLNKGEVEVGSVLFLTEKGVEVSWLEGYKSRNGHPPFEDILAVHDECGENMQLSNFSGRGWLTEAGESYVAQQEAATSPTL